MIHRVSVYLRYMSPHPSFPCSDRQHFSGNLPWQVENISIKHWLPWHRHLVLDNLSGLPLQILSSVHSVVDILQIFLFCKNILFFFLTRYFISNQKLHFLSSFLSSVSELLAADLLAFFVSADEPCPSLQVEDWRFPQTARHNITGKRPRPTADTRRPPSVIYKCPVCCRLQSGEAFLAAQECRCQKDPKPSGARHPSPGKDRTPTPHRVRSPRRHILLICNRKELHELKGLLLDPHFSFGPLFGSKVW